MCFNQPLSYDVNFRRVQNYLLCLLYNVGFNLDVSVDGEISYLKIRHNGYDIFFGTYIRWRYFFPSCTRSHRMIETEADLYHSNSYLAILKEDSKDSKIGANSVLFMRFWNFSTNLGVEKYCEAPSRIVAIILWPP